MNSDGQKVVAEKKNSEKLGMRILWSHWDSYGKLGSAKTWLISFVSAVTFLALIYMLS